MRSVWLKIFYLFLKIEQLNKISTLEVVQFVREKRKRQ